MEITVQGILAGSFASLVLFFLGWVVKGIGDLRKEVNVGLVTLRTEFNERMEFYQAACRSTRTGCLDYFSNFEGRLLRLEQGHDPAVLKAKFQALHEEVTNDS